MANKGASCSKARSSRKSRSAAKVPKPRRPKAARSTGLPLRYIQFGHWHILISHWRVVIMKTDSLVCTIADPWEVPPI